MTRDDQGFTFIETLVAMAIFGLILAAVATLTTTISRAKNTVEQRTEFAENHLLTLNAVKDRLSTIMPAFSEDLPPMELRQNLLRVITADSWEGRSPGLALLEINIESGDEESSALYLKELPFQAGLTDWSAVSNAPSRLLFRTEKPLFFSFLAQPEEGNQPTWMDSWFDVDEAPAAIRLTTREPLEPIPVLLVSRLSRAPMDECMITADCSEDEENNPDTEENEEEEGGFGEENSGDFDENEFDEFNEEVFEEEEFEEFDEEEDE